MKKILFVLSALALAGCSDNNNNNSAPAPSQEFVNVSYGSDPQQKMDIYLPEGHSASTKVVILVHGGGWTSGDKSDMASLLPLFRSSLPDYAYVNINYRLATDDSPAFPKQIDDIGLVISKLESGNYGISQEYAFVGVSAGAHLSLLYSYKVDTAHKVKTVCSVVGPTDFTDPAYTGAGINLASYVYLTGGNTDPAYFAAWSPVTFVSTQSPPTIQINGSADPLVPISQGERLKAQLDAFSVVNERHVYAGGHNTFSAADLIAENLAIQQFLSAHF